MDERAKADEQGDEFTAFATAKRNLVAEVQNTDPFDEAIELPRPAEPEKAEPAPEGDGRSAAPSHDTMNNGPARRDDDAAGGPSHAGG